MQSVNPTDDIALFRRHGLPYPIFANDQTATRAHNTWRLRVGHLAHDVIAEAAPLLGSLSDPDEIAEILCNVTREQVRSLRDARPHRVHLRAFALALKYAAEFLPPPPSTFSGDELATTNGEGRVDLVWTHPSLGVFIDELKTEVMPDNHEDRTLDQISRYLCFGREQYADRFAGVRLVTLGNRDSALMFNADGVIQPLKESRFSRHRLLTDRQSRSARNRPNDARRS